MPEADARDDIARRAVAGKSGMESRHVVVSHSGGRSAVIVQDDEQNSARHGARRSRRKGADEALLINTNGEVAETASGNLFWVYQDKICTAPTGAACYRESRARRSGNLPVTGTADEQARHQAGGVEKFRGHLCHAKRVGNHSGPV